MDDEFDIDFKLLPPELQVKLWILALDADTSKVNLKYTTGTFEKLTLGFSYNYGAAAEASLSTPQQSFKLGFDPSKSTMTGGLVFKGFRFGASKSVTNSGFGLSFGYGQALLPFPADMTTTFMNANTGVFSVMDKVRSFPDNPLKWYGMVSDDVDTITKGIDLGKKIHKVQTGKDRYGVGVGLSHSPSTGLVFTIGAQGQF